LPGPLQLAVCPETIGYLLQPNLVRLAGVRLQVLKAWHSMVAMTATELGPHLIAQTILVSAY